MAVTPTTIAVALGRTVPDESSAQFAQWEMWIGDALMLIEDRLGDVAELDQAKLDYVVREAVVAHIIKPDDATRVDVRIDDGAVAKSYTSAKGRVTILDEWWDLLSPTIQSGAFTIDTFPASSGLHAPWCSLMFDPTATCSCGVSLAGYPMYEPL